MFAGALGEPEGGWPPKLQSVILRGAKPATGRPGEHLAPVDFELAKKTAEKKAEQTISDADLMSYFRNRDGSEAGYDSYKTKVANLSSARSSAYGSRYCQQIARDFAASFRQGQTLKDFVAGERLLIAVPESCAVKYDLPEVAVAGVPSYTLPASPYGAAPVPVAPVAYNNPPPASRAPQRSPDQGWDGGYSAYGPPPGWLPPRQARRWDWYGHSAYNGYND